MTSTAPPARVVFVDVETTGLVVGVHEPWEIALIERRADGSEHEHLFYVRPKLSNADPAALRICRFHERTVNFLDLHDQPLDVKPQVVWASPLTVAAKVARITAGAHLVGNVVSFDAGMLDRFLRAHGQAPAWHYHLVDTEALAVGYLEGRRSMSKADTPPLQLPWRSADLSVAVGVEPPPAAHAHTALADARWTRDMYDAITGGAR